VAPLRLLLPLPPPLPPLLLLPPRPPQPLLLLPPTAIQRCCPLREANSIREHKSRIPNPPLPIALLKTICATS